MIRGILHKGSGLGNQLHRYVGTRVLALDSKQEFGMVAPDLFKGVPIGFKKLDFGNALFDYHIEEPAGKVIPHTSDPVVDGEFQGERYFLHRLNEVRAWLEVEPLEMPDDACVINFRGGEFALYPDLFLTPDYWAQAIDRMLEINQNMKFEIHTDDKELAETYFPDFRVVQDMGINWRSIRYAKHLILSNSSFAILPAHLNENVKEIIAPKFWGRRNKGYWHLPENEYKRFTYI